jgi:hypothetical protein
LTSLACGGLRCVQQSSCGLGGGVAIADTKKWTCTLTNTTVEKCCCVQQKDGKLYCTLAKKTVNPCCCKPAGK